MVVIKGLKTGSANIIVKLKEAGYEGVWILKEINYYQVESCQVTISVIEKFIAYPDFPLYLLPSSSV